MKKLQVITIALLLSISVLDLVGQNSPKVKHLVKIHTYDRIGEIMHEGSYKTLVFPNLDDEKIENLTYVVYAGAGEEIPYSINLNKGLTTVELYFSSPAYMMGTVNLITETQSENHQLECWATNKN